MWHASVAAHRYKLPASTLLEIAAEELAGVGDPALGEWTEHGDIAVHVRRRLSASEERGIGPACDIRGTWESAKRMNRMQKFLPPHMRGQEM